MILINNKMIKMKWNINKKIKVMMTYRNKKNKIINYKKLKIINKIVVLIILKIRKTIIIMS